MKDKQDRPYVKLADLKVGDVVQLDGDFTCNSPWSVHTVERDSEGKLFIPCDDGIHLLDGQCDDGIHCTGVYHAR